MLYRVHDKVKAERMGGSGGTFGLLPFLRPLFEPLTFF